MPHQPTVLIAHHLPHVSITLQHLLHQAGVRNITVVWQGDEAVAKALSLQPDLVLLDVLLPQIDGYGACQMIQQGWDTHGGRVWLLSERASHVDVDQARQVGAERVIEEPFDPDEVVALVQQTLGLKAMPTALAG